jgi:hypothetical protein
VVMIGNVGDSSLGMGAGGCLAGLPYWAALPQLASGRFFEHRSLRSLL